MGIHGGMKRSDLIVILLVCLMQSGYKQAVLFHMFWHGREKMKEKGMDIQSKKPVNRLSHRQTEKGRIDC